MPMYLTRVELHSASFSDYQNLHVHMTAAGFTTTIVNMNGVSYRLPPAEYLMSSSVNFTAAQVRDMAQAAASATGRANAVVVAKTEDIAWGGLSPA